MNEGKGSADQSAEEEKRSLGGIGAFLALCEERRMPCFPFEMLSRWGRAVPWWSVWKDPWEENVWPRRAAAWQTVIGSDKQSSPRHDSGMSAMPCPPSLSYSHQEKHRAFDLIWRLLDTSSRRLSGSFSGGNPIKMGRKARQEYLKSALCSEGLRVEAEGWKIFYGHSQSCCLRSGKHLNILSNQNDILEHFYSNITLLLTTIIHY